MSGYGQEALTGDQMFAEKMKTTILAGVAALCLLSACKKEGLPDTLSVKLSATTYYKNGSEETHLERSGTIERSSFARLVNDGGTNKFLINLGATGNAPDLSTFGVSFLFETTVRPEAVAGTYMFPRDQLQVKAVLRNEVTNTYTETIMYPTYGSVKFTYDSTAHSYSGSIHDLEFNIPATDPYGRYRVTVNGDYYHLPLQ